VDEERENSTDKIVICCQPPASRIEGQEDSVRLNLSFLKALRGLVMNPSEKGEGDIRWENDPITLKRIIPGMVEDGEAWVGEFITEPGNGKIILIRVVGEISESVIKSDNELGRRSIGRIYVCLDKDPPGKGQESQDIAKRLENEFNQDPENQKNKDLRIVVKPPFPEMGQFRKFVEDLRQKLAKHQ